ncbi:uncharacterized protein BT62DRAFT_939182 [Guyanagaster necrorhizus]|uniref:Uncharacterized protein n=1 Tax=Guyanagaster necrorhizus TaxID=856835 RepID=A0A9P8AKH8_9AGAR|nr:uncharacterized protein BT62DRAFT_939182 [Guyanagaster necrorhizus MCA 3950]KAG7439233.1 hypothetical protein BT62DRAFT_939182 [Guyanagaster necrorhizus MCA 3950]
MASSDVDSCCGLPDCGVRRSEDSCRNSDSRAAAPTPSIEAADQPCSCCSGGDSLEIDDTPAVQSRVDCAANAAESKQQVFIRKVR